MREEDHKIMDSTPAMESREQDKEVPVQNEDPAETREEDQLVREDYMDKICQV